MTTHNRFVVLFTCTINHDAVRKAQEAHLIHKGNTLFPLGINRWDEAH